MIKKNKVFIPILILLTIILSSFSVYGDSYNETGNYDSYYNTGYGSFGLTLPDISTSTKVVSTPRFNPTVSDLDNDTVNEIIVLSGSTFRLYHDTSLDVVDSFATGLTGLFSNYVAFDIDGDGYQEIMVISEFDEMLQIIEYNGTDFYLQNNFTLTGFSHTTGTEAGEMVLKCGAVEECLIVAAEDQRNSAANEMYAIPFNSTFVGSAITLDSESDSTEYYCLPNIRSMAYGDYDNDGDNEYVVSYMKADSNADEILIINWIYVNSTLGAVEELQKSDTAMGNPSNDGRCKDSGGGSVAMGKYITSPALSDFDESTSNGLETAVGFMNAATTATVRIYDKTGATSKTFETVGSVTHMSNLMVGNFFSDTSFDADVCGCFYDQTNMNLYFECGSINSGEANGLLYDSLNFEYSYEGFNTSTEYRNYQGICHATEHIRYLQSGTDRREILTAHGILTLDLDTCSLNGACTSSRDYEIPQTNLALTSVDVTGIGLADIIGLSNTNLWYINDGFENTPGNLTYYSINPCITSVWKVNTSVGINIRVTDAESDLVSARAILYEGDSNEQDSGWSTNQSSGTTFPFSFVANKTINNGNIKLQARDYENPTDITTYQLTFSVSNNGVELGDCVYEFDAAAAAEADANALNATTVNQNDNSIKNAMTTVGGLWGLSETIIWLIVMICVAIGIIMNMPANLQSHSLIIVMVVEGLLLITGALLGFISTGIILIITIIATLGLSMWLRKLFTGTSE